MYVYNICVYKQTHAGILIYAHFPPVHTYIKTPTLRYTLLPQLTNIFMNTLRIHTHKHTHTHTHTYIYTFCTGI